MAKVYVMLVANGRRTIDSVPEALRLQVRELAESMIGQMVGTVLLTQELYNKMFAVQED